MEQARAGPRGVRRRVLGLIAVGLMTGKAILPFGVSIESGGSAGLISEELVSLRKTDERIFERLGALNKLLEGTLVRVKVVEDQLRGRSGP